MPRNILKEALHGDSEDRIRVNKKYAAKFEEKKKREELERGTYD